MMLFLWLKFRKNDKNRYTGEWFIIYMYLFLPCLFIVKNCYKLLKMGIQWDG